MAQPAGVAPSTYARFYLNVQIMWLKLDEICGQDSALCFPFFPRQSVEFKHVESVEFSQPGTCSLVMLILIAKAGAAPSIT